MNRFILPLGGFALLVLVLFLGVKTSPERSTLQSVLIGKPAPEFTLPDLMNPGRQLSSKDWAGNAYVLNVWGTWCPGCRQEHETLLRIAQLGQAPLIGINWKDEDSLAHEWLAQLGNPYAAIVSDHSGRTAIDWGVYGAPETFLVDSQGLVQYRHVGPMTMEVWEKQFVPRITGKPVDPS